MFCLKRAPIHYTLYSIQGDPNKYCPMTNFEYHVAFERVYGTLCTEFRMQYLFGKIMAVAI